METIANAKEVNVFSELKLEAIVGIQYNLCLYNTFPHNSSE